MSIIEIISGVVLILAAIAIILLTLAQESKGRGLSGAIMGEGGMMEAGRIRGRDVKLAQATRVVSIVFFLVVIAVSILSVIGMN